jgi:hypothetical protein
VVPGFLAWPWPGDLADGRTDGVCLPRNAEAVEDLAERIADGANDSAA